MRTIPTHQEFVTTWMDRVWCQEDADAIDEMFVVDGPAHGLGGRPLLGPAEFRQFHTALLKLIGNIEFKLDLIIEQDNWFSYLGELSGTCRRTGRTATLRGGAVCLMEDGRILEAYNTWDFLSFFGDLGLAPEDAFARGLAGEPICGK